VEARSEASKDWKVVDRQTGVEWDGRQQAHTFVLQRPVRAQALRWWITGIRDDNDEHLGCRLRHCTQVTSFMLLWNASDAVACVQCRAGETAVAAGEKSAVGL